MFEKFVPADVWEKIQYRMNKTLAKTKDNIFTLPPNIEGYR